MSLGRPLLLIGGGLLLMSILAFASSDARTLGLLATSCRLGFCVVGLAVPVGVMVGWLVARTDVWGGALVERLLLLMLFVPLHLQAAGWDAGFGRQGWLSLGWDLSGDPWLSGFRAAVWIHALAAIPWVAWSVGLALRHLDPEVEELAHLELPFLSAMTRVTLPLIGPAIVAASLWVLVATLGEMTVTDLYQVRTFAEETYVMVPLQDPSGEGTGLNANSATVPSGTLWLILVNACGMLALWVVQWNSPFVLSPVRSPRRWTLGAWHLPAVGLLGLLVFLLVGVPVGSLLYNAGVEVKPVAGELVRSWSPTKVVTVVAHSPFRFGRELGWSTVIGGVTATAALALAVPCGWLARRGGVGALPAILGGVLGLSLPGPTVGLWLVRFFSQPDPEWLGWLYDHSILAPVLASMCRAFPAALLVSWYGLRSMPQELLEAASVDGLTPGQTFRRVIWPLRWRSLVAGWLAAFLLASNDLSASILVTPPGLFTVPVRLFGLLHAGVDEQVAGLCLTNLGLLILVQCVWWRLRPTAQLT